MKWKLLRKKISTDLILIKKKCVLLHVLELWCKVDVNISLFLCSVGVFKNGRVEIIANDQGNRITPSYVAFTPEGERLIGDGAKNQLTSNPENTVFDAKRLIGRNWDDPSVQHDMKFFPFKLVKKNDKPHVQLNVKGESKEFAAEEISAMVLSKMKVAMCFCVVLTKENLP